MLFRSELKKMIIEERIALDKIRDEMVKIDHMNFVYLLEKIFSLFEKTKIIQEITPYLKDYHKGRS